MHNRKLLKITKNIIVIILFSLSILSLINIESKEDYIIPNLDQPINYLKTGNLDANPIFIDAEATGVNAHNWTWAVSQVWCNGSGTEVDPYRISYLNINGMGVNNCIEIRNSKSDYFMIDHCIFSNAGNADPHKFAANIFINNSKYGTILSNQILGASSDLALGMYIEDCLHVSIQSNNISDNRFGGIQLSHSFASNISNNNILNNHYMGISVQEGSQTINIWNNLIIQNYDGIGISEGSYSSIYNNSVIDNYIHGIICVDCYNIEIASNTVRLNDYVGIYIQECKTLSVIYNTIKQNEYGIIFKLSDTNHIYDNVITHNNYYPLWLYSSNNNRILGNIITQNKETFTQIDCVGNELIENYIFNKPEEQFLTILIIGTAFLTLLALLLIRRWRKAER